MRVCDGQLGLYTCDCPPPSSPRVTSGREEGKLSSSHLFASSGGRLVTLTRPNRLIPPVIYCTSRGLNNKYSFINFCFDLTFDVDRGMAQASSITANRERYLANSEVLA